MLCEAMHKLLGGGMALKHWLWSLPASQCCGDYMGLLFTTEI